MMLLCSVFLSLSVVALPLLLVLPLPIATRELKQRLAPLLVSHTRTWSSYKTLTQALAAGERDLDAR